MGRRSVNTRVSPRVAAAPPGAALRAGMVTALLLGGALLVHLGFVSAPGWEWDVDNFVKWTSIAIERGVAHVGEVIECIYPPGFLYLLKGTGCLAAGRWRAAAGGGISGAGSWPSCSRCSPTSRPPGCCIAWPWRKPRRAPKPQVWGSGARAARARRLCLQPGDAVHQRCLGPGRLVDVAAAAAGRVGGGAAPVCTGVRAGGGGGPGEAPGRVVWPALLLLVLHLGGLDGLFAAVRGAAVTALLLLLPYFAAGRMEALITTITFGASGLFPKASLNAHNLWWLMLGSRARDLSDAMRLGNGLLTYASAGALLFAGATALILWRLWRRSTAPDATPRRAVRRRATRRCATRWRPHSRPAHCRYSPSTCSPPRSTIATSCRRSSSSRRCASGNHGCGGRTGCVRWPRCCPWPARSRQLSAGNGAIRLFIPAPLLRPDRAETLVLSAIFLGLFVGCSYGLADKQYTYIKTVANETGWDLEVNKDRI